MGPAVPAVSRDCKALAPDGRLALAQLCSPGSRVSFEIDCRPSLKKNSLIGLKIEKRKQAEFPLHPAFFPLWELPLK